VQAHYEYDALNRLTNVVHTGSGNLLLSRFSYGLHTNGWRQTATEIQRQVNGTYVTNQFGWGCDNLGRLTNETCGSALGGLNYTNSYVHDLAGNRLWKTNVMAGVTEVIGYTNDANDQLVVESYGSGSFTNYYDANGELTNRSSATQARW
jgi:hypothetical protein